MASETKAATSRRKSSAEPKAAVKPAPKTTAKAKTGASKAAPKKAVSPKAEKPVEKKPATRKGKATGQPITAETRLRHIEVAAYYVAEKSGFSRSPADCWIAAESEIDGLLLAGKLPA